MRDYVIITDSTTDLPNKYILENNLVVIPLQYTINNKAYLNYADERQQSFKDFYSQMRTGAMSITSQLNSEDIKKVYIPYLMKGLDVLAICFSSGLSGTYNSARLAVDELTEEYPKRKILLIDSLAASMGEGLFVHYAITAKKTGKSLEENYESLMALRLRVCHWFTVSDIDLLRRGGRVSGAAAFIAKTIKINPVLHVDDKGHLIPKFKKIGRKQALKELVVQLEKTIDKSYKQTIFLSHGDCLDDALYVKSLIENFDYIENIIINYIGPVIGSHSGPGTVALFYIGSNR